MSTNHTKKPPREAVAQLGPKGEGSVTGVSRRKRWRVRVVVSTANEGTCWDYPLPAGRVLASGLPSRC